jgi:glycosyltransferase involved in cell wall biosynthesis
MDKTAKTTGPERPSRAGLFSLSGVGRFDSPGALAAAAARRGLSVARRLPMLGPRRLAMRASRRTLPVWLRQMVGNHPRRLLRLQTVALMVGDDATALRLARPRNGRSDEHRLFVALAAEWERGDERSVREHALEQLELGGDARLRGVARFFLYLEDPEAAQRALDRSAGLDPALALDVADAWLRHGVPERAASLAAAVLAADPANPAAEAIAARAHSERLLASWQWAAAAEPESFSPLDGRVLHMVARSLPEHRAGSTFRTHYLVQAQRWLGIDAQVVTGCGFPAADSGGTELHLDVPYHRLAAVGQGSRVELRLRAHVEAAAELIRELRPALLHPASDYLNATVAIELGRRFGIPVVYEVRGFPEEYLPRRPGSRVLHEKWGGRRVIEAQCWRRADHIVTLAEVMKEHIVAKGVPADRVTVVPNAVDAEVFEPTGRDLELASRLGIAAEDTVLGYVTSFNAYEGLRYLIEAGARLRLHGRRAKVLLVGDGPERAHLEQLARRLGVAEHVIFTGRLHHDEVGRYYDLIDVFVVPRTSEATTELVTPLKPYEAMAMRKPVLVSGTRALREMVIDGETGLHFRPEDAGDLVNKAELLIDDRELARRVGRAGREWVMRNRSWAANAEIYRELYASLGVEIGAAAGA